jgi:hypothetical protein
MVSAGTYYLADSMTFDSRVQFEGTLVMPDSAILSLTKNYELPSYIDAFGNEEQAFKKAFQALLNNSDHESLDLGGRQISLSAPIDMQAAVSNRTAFAQRRHVCNGQFSPIAGPAWDNQTVTSQATYSPSNSVRLTNVVNVANIQVGSLVTGNGVGREVYVRSKNVPAQEVTLSLPLYDAAGTQNYTFTRFKYLLDFSNFDHLDKFSMSDIEFQCSGDASAILLPPSGLIFHLRDCFITRPKNRGITSHGEGCQGMLIDRCQFLSDESPLLSQDRISIALNTNANDVKLRNNRAVHFRHFAVMAGSGSIISGNHWFQGDYAQNAIRTAGIALSRTNCRASITGNYIDNSFVEWANEHDAAPEFSSELSFSGMNITDNICLASDVAPWFTFIVVKPHGAGHFINGMSVSGNIFRNINGLIDRPERVDTSHASLDFSRMRNVTFAENMYNQVSVAVQNPLVIRHTEASEGSSWTVNCGPQLPFGSWALGVESVQADEKITTVSNVAYYGVPYVQTRKGANKDQIYLRWERDLKGTVMIRVRSDNLV